MALATGPNDEEELWRIMYIKCILNCSAETCAAVDMCVQISYR